MCQARSVGLPNFMVPTTTIIGGSGSSSRPRWPPSFQRSSARYDEGRDSFWTALLGGRVEGSIAIDGIHAESEEAHLRWFIVSDALRGRGIGHRLMNGAIDFCRNKGYKRVYLWSFEGLDAARHVYEKVGFRLVEEHRGSQWGVEVNEQRFELQLE
jgi:GNAT superfamily N-acetyltransferase